MTAPQRHETFRAPQPEETAEVRPDSVALARLIAEVELGEEFSLERYNRTYHRHNR
jgi:hypothetical protein